MDKNEVKPVSILDQLLTAITEVQAQGGKIPEIINGLILPVNVLDLIEVEMKKNPDFYAKKSFNGLEVLVSADNEQIRFCKIF